MVNVPIKNLTQLLGMFKITETEPATWLQLFLLGWGL